MSPYGTFPLFLGRYPLLLATLLILFPLLHISTPSVYAQGLDSDEPMPPSFSQETVQVDSADGSEEELITLDFNNVDLVVFTKFVSEIIGKNFIIDERVRGKVTIFSPAKISVNKVYTVFESVMAMKGFAVIPTEETIQIIPAAEVTVEREIFIYFLENADAEETSKLMSSIVAQRTRPGKKAPKKGKKAATSAEFAGQIQITPDKSINALIIRATVEDYDKLVRILEQLDIKRQQVFVETVIMEVNQSMLREFGTEIAAVTGYTSPGDEFAIFAGFNTVPEAGEALAGTLETLGFGIGEINVRAVITALKDLTDANILSMPQLLTTHNQKARIVVGQNVPFVTGSSTSTGGLVQRNVTRQDVGVTLELTPKVMEEGRKVQLDIRQEISTLSETAESVLVELGPTTNKREAQTSVIVDNGHTVVIGGLMSDNISVVERKIPLLGDIPLIGWLFRFQSKRVVKTNLLIFLTPHVLQDSEDLQAILKKKTEGMRASLMGLRKKYMRSRTEILDAINLPVSNPRR